MSDEEIAARVKAKLEAGRAFVALAYVDGDKLYLEVKQRGFPHADYRTMYGMLKEQINKMVREDLDNDFKQLALEGD